MPAYLKPTEFLVKDESTGNYSDINVLAERSTAQTVDAITAEGTIQISKVNTVGTTHVSAVESKGEEKLTQINTVGASYLSSIGSKGEEKLTQINTAGATQVAAIENKGEETLDSIPSDYTSLANQVDSQGESINNLEANKVNSDNVYTYKSKSGSIVTVDDAVAEVVKQMRIEIAPVQDLHGYDNPWPAGGSKNLLPTIPDATTSGITAKNNPDGSISVTGTTAISDIFVTQSVVTLPAGTYTVTGGNNFCKIRIGKVAGGELIAHETGSGYSLTLSEETNMVFALRVQLSSGTTVNTTVYPMVRLSSVTDATFVPYSNICPISGWTEANVTRRGKNLVDLTKCVTGQYIAFDGTISTSDVNMMTMDFMSVKEGENYVFSGISGRQETAARRIHAYYPNKQWMEQIDVVSGNFQIGTAFSKTVTIPSGCAYVRFGTAKLDTNLQFELGKTATSYTQFTGDNTYPITFPDSAGTVYGGTLTYNKDGSVTILVTHKNLDLSSLNWQYNSTYSLWKASGISDIVQPSNDQNAKIISDTYKIMTATALDDDDIGCLAVSNNYTTWCNTGSTSVEPSGYVVYELASPTTVTLTAPELLTMLQGYNTVYADCGNIDLLYAVRDFLTTEQVDKERIHETISTPAGVQTFPDGADNLPMALKVGIEPVQDLHGYENPWPAGGGKNLLSMTVDWIKIHNTAGTWSGNTYTHNGVAYTIQTDAANNVIGIKASGTASSLSLFDTGSLIADGSTYYTSGCPSGGGGAIYQLQFIDNTTGQYLEVADTGSGCTLQSISAHTYYLEIVVRNGKTAPTASFLPITSKTQGDSFAPYSNICPISGWTEANVTRRGKNLYSGGDVTVGTGAGTQFWTFDRKPNTKYTVGFVSPVAFPLGVRNGGSTQAVAGQNVITFDLGSSLTGTFLFYVNGALSEHITLTECFVTEGTISPSDYVYEPFGTTYHITFPSEAGTVYGGTLTVNQDGSGELVVDRASITLNGSEAWDADNGGKRVSTNAILNSVKRVTGSTVANILSDKFTAKLSSSTYNGNVGISVDNGGWLGICDGTYPMTEEGWKTYLQTNNLQVVYELATPVTYSLTPGQVKTLLGVNNIWADCGNINEVQYPADTKLYVDHQISASQRLMELIVTANHEDEMKATKAYSTGNLLIVNGTLYKATTSIANGANLTVNTNVIATTVAAELAALA